MARVVVEGNKFIVESIERESAIVAGCPDGRGENARQFKIKGRRVGGVWGCISMRGVCSPAYSEGG
jgi:hypothetical protein